MHRIATVAVLLTGVLGFSMPSSQVLAAHPCGAGEEGVESGYVFFSLYVSNQRFDETTIFQWVKPGEQPKPGYKSDADFSEPICLDRSGPGVVYVYPFSKLNNLLVDYKGPNDYSGRSVQICRPGDPLYIGRLLAASPDPVHDPQYLDVCDQVVRLAPGSVTGVTPGLPTSASAALVNITMTDGLAPGYITADRCSVLTSGSQTKSSGNHATIATANLSVVLLDNDGRFCIYNQSSVNLVVDTQGYFAAPGAGGQTFLPTAPTRVLDTRILPTGRPAGGSITKVSTGVIAGTTAVLANLTMVNGSAPGYITADKCSTLSSGQQSKSSGNFTAGAPIANLSVVPVDSDGSFCVYNQTAVDLLVDVQGSFRASGGVQFTSSPPRRMLDTRTGTQPAAGTVTEVQTNAPAGTTAVLANLTMTGAAAPGYITADRCSAMTAGPQSRSSANYAVGAPIANLASVPIDADGRFCIYNQTAVDLVVDLQGSFSASGTQQFFPTPPARVLDTRS